jgi:hypothetical protein
LRLHPSHNSAMVPDFSFTITYNSQN